ncbi:MAG: PorP/SprF family type IX secretion system membrane protein [Bacteroidales bacterium]|nr:PorP/SprF family type IX secretion system membrane protein [Bacteroidales bacterium]
MKRRIYYIWFLIFLLVSPVIKAQDMYFSQYFSSPLFLSPSLAGAAKGSRVIINYRNQWPNLSRAFVNYAISFDHNLYDYNSGIGILAVRSQEGGVYNTTHLGALYNYSIEVNREIRVRPGVQAGYYFKNINYNEIDFGDEISRGSSSTIEIPKDPNVNHFDFSGSLLVHTSFYWLGVTGDHLLAINPQFGNDPTYPDLKISAYGGAQLKLFQSVISKKKRTFTVSFLYKNQSKFHQLDLGTYYEEEPFRIGIFGRAAPTVDDSFGLNAIVLLAGYTYSNFLINYSYDITTSRMLASTGGAHEISLAIKFDNDYGGRRKRMGAVPCPEF